MESNDDKDVLSVPEMLGYYLTDNSAYMKQ